MRFDPVGDRRLLRCCDRPRHSSAWTRRPQLARERPAFRRHCGGRRAQPIRSAESDVAATGYKDGKWFEQEGKGPVETFRNPNIGASRTGEPIKALAIVRVSCRRYVEGVESAHPEGFCYRIESQPWDNKAYAPSNAFWNGSDVVSGSRRKVHGSARASVRRRGDARACPSP